MKTNVEVVRNLLKTTFTIVPIVAGLDKFTNLLTDWGQYLSPAIKEILPLDPAIFMMIIGVVEISAGILVIFNTKIGAFVVSAWLAVIALTLIFSWSFVDIAVRDLVMAIGALSLGLLVNKKNSIA